MLKTANLLQFVKCYKLSIYKQETDLTRKFSVYIGNKNCDRKCNKLSVEEKFIVYKEKDASKIFDIEERTKEERTYFVDEEKYYYGYSQRGLNLKRGLTGVYDIEDLKKVLERQNAKNIFVCPIIKELKYVDFMCIVTGENFRHRLAIAQFVKKIYKLKRNPNDPLTRIEGENCEHWIAMDLGNIVLHIFSEEAREKYDLETLWALGSEFDQKLNDKS